MDKKKVGIVCCSNGQKESSADNVEKLRKILLGIIVVGLIVAGFQITLRVVAEQRNTVVEIVADLDSFISLGKKMNKNEVELLKELRMAGVNSIAVSEATIQQLSEAGKIQVYENGCVSSYALCKLDYIELGRTLI